MRRKNGRIDCEPFLMLLYLWKLWIIVKWIEIQHISISTLRTSGTMLQHFILALILLLVLWLFGCSQLPEKWISNGFLFLLFASFYRTHSVSNIVCDEKNMWKWKLYVAMYVILILFMNAMHIECAPASISLWMDLEVGNLQNDAVWEVRTQQMLNTEHTYILCFDTVAWSEFWAIRCCFCWCCCCFFSLLLCWKFVARGTYFFHFSFTFFPSSLKIN